MGWMGLIGLQRAACVLGDDRAFKLTIQAVHTIVGQIRIDVLVGRGLRPSRAAAPSPRMPCTLQTSCLRPSKDQSRAIHL